MLFASDNWSGVHPEIMAAITAANDGSTPAYGADKLTTRVQHLFNEIFECECAVFFVATGSAANGLSLSQLAAPVDGILCSDVSHINIDEPGTVELFTGGARLIPLRSTAGKLNPDQIREEMKYYHPPLQRRVRASVLSLTQGTESGTVYSASEVEALCEAAKSFGLNVHMDGARFGNAVAHLGCAPADITWRAGVDVLSFGATKNGALAAEAIVFFDKSQAEGFGWRQSRAGQVFSKNRFIAVQWEALLKNDLWLNIATQANSAAARLSEGLTTINGCEVIWPTQINEVFATFPDNAVQAMLDLGAQFYPWVYPGDKWDGRLHRLVTSYLTTDEEVNLFLEKLRNLNTR